MRQLIAVITCAMLAGCVNAPTQSEAAAQYYGPEIQQSDAETQAKALMQEKLKDPYSAVWQCVAPQKGWIGSGMAFGPQAQTYYGWVLICEINSKNSFGAYTGGQQYRFLFLNGQLMRAALFSQQGIFPTQQVIFSR